MSNQATRDKTKWNSVVNVFNQQKEDVATKLSKEMGSEEDPQYRIPCREVTNGNQTECGPQGIELTIIEDAPPLSVESSDSEWTRYSERGDVGRIYNEQVRDLLLSGGAQRRLDICNISQPNGLNVPDASLSPVKYTQDVLDLMQIGQKNRSVGATALNEQISHSHSVLAVHDRGKEILSGSILKSCLHLVDLAGSERVDKSDTVGERLREAQNINKSLSALGDVISALAEKNKHIPYRNSKLTQVLQDSSGGPAKTMMFVHINPELNSYGETINRLKFVERVASIELGAARSNKETAESKNQENILRKIHTV